MYPKELTFRWPFPERVSFLYDLRSRLVIGIVYLASKLMFMGICCFKLVWFYLWLEVKYAMVRRNKNNHYRKITLLTWLVGNYKYSIRLVAERRIRREKLGILKFGIKNQPLPRTEKFYYMCPKNFLPYDHCIITFMFFISLIPNFRARKTGLTNLGRI